MFGQTITNIAKLSMHRNSRKEVRKHKITGTRVPVGQGRGPLLTAKVRQRLLHIDPQAVRRGGRTVRRNRLERLSMLRIHALLQCGDPCLELRPQWRERRLDSRLHARLGSSSSSSSSKVILLWPAAPVGGRRRGPGRPRRGERRRVARRRHARGGGRGGVCRGAGGARPEDLAARMTLRAGRVSAHRSGAACSAAGHRVGGGGGSGGGGMPRLHPHVGMRHRH
eukprot:scaffold46493_cov61-Phaeocystis_antarctica.AAC.3